MNCQPGLREDELVLEKGRELGAHIGFHKSTHIPRTRFQIVEISSFCILRSKLRKFCLGPEGPRFYPLGEHWSSMIILGILEMTFVFERRQGNLE